MSRKPRGRGEEIDDKDLRILEILQKNSDITFTELGKILDISPSTAYIRVKKLRKTGYIKKTIALIDYDKLGFRIKALIFIKTDPKKMEDVVESLKRFDKIVSIYDVTGEPTVVAFVIVKNHIDLAKILDDVGKIDGVISTSTMVIMRTFKEEYELSLTDIK
ncbi:MAG: winged helix-turn-helix transcriptional regulator [Desulfurococcales archaeon]|nr:Lrp/AsnC family transcriptional regulator [Desulfurococcales archaeon]MCC6062089.1 Lrp/AsnC family transcriptional regulator [Desulfurococcales archaeon]NAZ12842.1 winged helix-turn-helix transcriptional regulator [Desulfurococcales archaeon]